MSNKADGGGKVPKLRFPKFRDAPAWKVKPLASICEMRAGKFVAASEIRESSEDGLYPCYGGNGLRGYTTTRTHTGKYPLVGRQGALCGNVALATGSFHATEHAVVASPRSNVNVDWLFYLLTRLDLNQYATGQAQPGLSVESLERVSTYVPREEQEQRQIGDCLSSIDEVIAAETQKLGALKAHKKGLMQRMFPAEGETVPELRFPEFRNAEAWNVGVFDEAVEIIDGDRGRFYPKSDEFSSTGYCVFLNAKNVTKSGFRFDEIQFVSKEKDEKLRKGKLKRSDVVLTTRGSVGQFALYSEEIPYENIRINSGMVILRTNSKTISPEYFYVLCRSEILAAHISDIAFGNAQQQLTVAGIKKFPLVYPHPREQREIAELISSIDRLIEGQSKKVESLKAHKKGLMQQLFPAPDEAHG